MAVVVRASLALVALLSATLGPASAWEWQQLSNMKMKTGDVITCRLSGLLNTHWMMATDEDHVIMVWPGQDGTYVMEERRDSVVSSFTGVNWDKCWNYGMQGAGGGTYVLARARRHLNQKIYYHLLTCNCEHYVKFWTEMNYNVNQSGSRASSYCSFFKAKEQSDWLSHPNEIESNPNHKNKNREKYWLLPETDGGKIDQRRVPQTQQS